MGRVPDPRRGLASCGEQDPRLLHPAGGGSNQVLTWGTPPRWEGCRPASQGSMLGLLTCGRSYTGPAHGANARRSGVSTPVIARPGSGSRTQAGQPATHATCGDRCPGHQLGREPGEPVVGILGQRALDADGGESPRAAHPGNQPQDGRGGSAHALGCGPKGSAEGLDRALPASVTVVSAYHEPVEDDVTDPDVGQRPNAPVRIATGSWGSPGRRRRCAEATPP